ncbi:MAG: RdgB/HAM1 family non-canonical purine NTP pyrophosphatase [Actinobacteria bacterium]|nr:RdgB/HAM1 family non-canonical purine NTP pyrophosphatase [Actinomycetota bacterium]MCA1719660.1 RdgB/HAM1 family non-canonical purine NTP pyrophosphatase [Actinomycetota bacterium]
MRVLLATRNAGKVEELQRILTGVDLVGLDEVTAYEPGPETESTFRGNALLKAREACAATGLPSVADDSGLEVDALNGMPGVLSARWAGRHGNDVANLELLLGQVADVPDNRLGARFVCAAAAVLPDGRELVVEADMTGRLLRVPRGTNGFGYDPVFLPAGSELSSAELTPEAKDAISHRGKAFRELAPLLLDALAGRPHDRQAAFRVP